jgi:hypothetical protein
MSYRTRTFLGGAVGIVSGALLFSAGGVLGVAAGLVFYCALRLLDD